MRTFVEWVDAALDAMVGRGMDARFTAGRVVDTGPCAHRARSLAGRLNAVRVGAPKEPVVVWDAPYAALTPRGGWVYLSRALAEALSDDGLAFVLAHELAHHDLRHLAPPMVAAGLMGHAPRMELLADADGFRLMCRAGFHGRGALEALDDALWTEPADPLPGVQGWIDRLRTTHPPLEVRRTQIRRLIETS